MHRYNMVEKISTLYFFFSCIGQKVVAAKAWVNNVADIIFGGNYFVCGR